MIRMGKTADAVIIGAGVIGAAAAYALSGRGAKVILVEAGDIAQGTSSKSDGNILVSDKMPGYDAKLAKLSQDMFPALSRKLDYDIEWTQKGSLQLVENETEKKKAEEYCQALIDSGIPARMLNEKQVREDEPLVSPKVIGGLEVDCDGSVYPMGLCFGLAAGAKKNGAEIMTRTKVTGIVRAGRIEKVLTSRGDIYTNTVINCAGIWSGEIGAMAGLQIPVQPRQGQILVAEQTFQVARRKVVEFGYLMAKFQGSDYKRDVSPEIEEYGVAFVFEPTRANNFLIGSSRRFVGRDTRNHFGVMKALAERAVHFFPVMKDIKIIRAYAGLRPFMPDHLPVISDTPVPGFYISTGHEGDGIGLSLISAEIIANMITGKKQPIDVTPLSFSRLAAGERV